MRVVTDIPTGKAAVFANPKLKVLNFAEGKGFKTSQEDVEIGIAIRKATPNSRQPWIKCWAV